LTFTLTVTNQGTVDAYNIDLTDYIPSDMSLNDIDWTENVLGEADLNVPIAGPLAPGASTTVNITLMIDPTFQGDAITNYAEISDADDDNDPTNGTPDDIDSTPDSDENNDGPAEDNVTDNPRRTGI